MTQFSQSFKSLVQAADAYRVTLDGTPHRTYREVGQSGRWSKSFLNPQRG